MRCGGKHVRRDGRGREVHDKVGVAHEGRLGEGGAGAGARVVQRDVARGRTARKQAKLRQRRDGQERELRGADVNLRAGGQIPRADRVVLAHGVHRLGVAGVENYGLDSGGMARQRSGRSTGACGGGSAAAAIRRRFCVAVEVEATGASYCGSDL